MSNYLQFNGSDAITNVIIRSSVERLAKILLRDQSIIDEQLGRSNGVLHDGGYAAIRRFQYNDRDPFLENEFFNGADAPFGYAMVADHRPSSIIEVGAGNSTRCFRRAAVDYGLDLRIVAVNPAPRSAVRDICDEVVQKSIIDVDLGMFDELRRGAFGFFDMGRTSCRTAQRL